MALRVKSSSTVPLPGSGAWHPPSFPPAPNWYPTPMPPAIPVAPTPIIINPVTEEDIRRIVREELDRESPPDKP